MDLLNKAYGECFPYLLPVRLDISLTTDCDINCAYCWHQKKNGSLLTYESLAGIIDLLSLKRPPRLNLTGGEPTIFPDFERILEHAHKSGIKNILLCTNGYRLREMDFAERIIGLGLTALNISVDTLDSAKFEMLRGYKFSDFEKVLKNCLSLKEKFPNVNISLVSVMSREVTPDELYEVKKLCISNKLGYFVQTFDNTKYREINKRFALRRKERREYLERLSWLDGRVGDVVKRAQNPLTQKGKSTRCYKGITTVKLSSDGSIGFCWQSKPVGNILKSSFIEIWNSEAARRARAYIRDKRCRCDFDCDVFESLDLYDII
ncbi:MAG: radical SAM protein [Candidatus Omnitrophica bacterium]|nr:radical SAM protein [Candidatus Omnitrophota bacterium]MBU1929361.1 radical SAM protein [Candidatus Omnitrophota bacterium]MBU2035653.1 radical SAM protein [Candidatus Omnitrophota bacterium]